MKKIWNTPSGSRSALYASMLEQPHLLIAGATGSGKSVVINGLIHAALFNSPSRVEFVLIDPKRVELAMYRDLPHTITHAAGYNPEAWIRALTQAVELMDKRYAAMERARQRTYEGGDVYAIIDEWATIYKAKAGRECYRLLLRLTSEGRAARVHVIMATQVPKAAIIPTEVRENFTARLALRCNTTTESRVLMERSGCESLPRHGQGYYLTPEGLTLRNLTMIPEDELTRITDFWLAQKPRRSWFAA